jgi:hypothetical protein
VRSQGKKTGTRGNNFHGKMDGQVWWNGFHSVPDPNGEPPRIRLAAFLRADGMTEPHTMKRKPTTSRGAGKKLSVDTCSKMSEPK